MAKITNSTFNSIEDSLALAFESVSPGIKIILDMQNGVEPATPYCHMFIVSETPTGMGSESGTIDKTTRTTIMSQQWEALVRFVFVGKDKQVGGSDTNAANYAEEFCQRMQSVYYRQLFADNGLSVLRVAGNKRSQQKRETDIYSLSTVDVSLAYAKHTTLTYPSIDHGKMVGTLSEAENGTATVTLNY